MIQPSLPGDRSGEPPSREPDIKPFTYLLNAMEVAAWAEKPSERGYEVKRKAVFDYVREALRAARGGSPPAPSDSPQDEDTIVQLERIIEEMRGVFGLDAGATPLLHDYASEIAKVFEAHRNRHGLRGRSPAAAAPSEPSEEAVEAAYKAAGPINPGARPSPHWRARVEAMLTAAYAVDFGGRAAAQLGPTPKREGK